MAKIFVSYRHVNPDELLAEFIHQKLTRGGHQVFLDTQILAGTKWPDEIERRLRAAEFFVVLLSQESIRSDMVRREVELSYELARDPHHSVVILPVRVNFVGALPYDLGAYLNALQYVLWREGELFDKVVEDLAAAIEQQKLLPHSAVAGEAEDLGSLFDATEGRGAPMPGADPRLIPDLFMETGAMRPGSAFYIERCSDAFLLAQVELSGVTVAVKGARQTGKSSLLARAFNKVKSGTSRTLYLDFQLFDAEAIHSLGSLCEQLARKAAQAFETKNTPDSAWDERLGPKDNLTAFLEREVLAEMPQSVVLFLDEVDRIFGYPYCDDFFALVRAWHNLRSRAEPWGKLNIVITHSTEPYLWIRDINQSPFNVGDRIELSDFSLRQVAELNLRHGSPVRDQNELQALFRLVGGHPYLTRQALYTMAKKHWSVEKIESVSANDRGPFGDHLRSYLWDLNRSQGLRSALRQVLRNRCCEDEDRFLRLRAAGLVAGEERTEVSMRCQLYADYFSKHL